MILYNQRKRIYTVANGTNELEHWDRIPVLKEQSPFGLGLSP
jgi:hypothetical protein